MIDLSDVLFLLGLGLLASGAWVTAGWPGVVAAVGAVIMVFGLMRQWPRGG